MVSTWDPSLYVQADNPCYNHYILHAFFMDYVIEALNSTSRYLFRSLKLLDYFDVHANKLWYIYHLAMTFALVVLFSAWTSISLSGREFQSVEEA